MSISAKDVASKNDFLRKTFMTGRVVLSLMVREADNLEDILAKVRSFDHFDSDNDPYGEHDCGVVSVDGDEYIFKIDYYNFDYTMGADPYQELDIVQRVLTIMHSSEY